MKESSMPWGYFEVDPKYYGADFRAGVAPAKKSNISVDKTYCLVGCEPDTMFRPGTEPKGFRWFWWDNSMMPHLRHPSPANPNANKLWSRLTYCGWSMPEHHLPRWDDRQRVNDILQHNSRGVIRDISQLWKGTQSTSPLSNRRCLVLRSSDRNYREFYGETWDEYWARIEPVLKRHGFEYTVRRKVAIKARIGNQVVDEIRRGGYDCVLANHSAGASEAVVTGTPVITTSPWNPTRRVSTPWEHFAEYGDVLHYDAEFVDSWVTAICGYTYYRPELNTLSWIDYHPDAKYLKEAKNAI